MKLSTAPTSAVVVPVAVATITKSATPVVNSQPSSAAPNGSGKNMVQFEALIGNAASCYPNTYLAHRSCVQAAALAGLSNYANVPSDPNAVRILAW